MAVVYSRIAVGAIVSILLCFACSADYPSASVQSSAASVDFPCPPELETQTSALTAVVGKATSGCMREVLIERITHAFRHHANATLYYKRQGSRRVGFELGPHADMDYQLRLAEFDDNRKVFSNLLREPQFENLEASYLRLFERALETEDRFLRLKDWLYPFKPVRSRNETSEKTSHKKLGWQRHGEEIFPVYYWNGLKLATSYHCKHLAAELRSEILGCENEANANEIIVIPMSEFRNVQPEIDPSVLAKLPAGWPPDLPRFSFEGLAEEIRDPTSINDLNFLDNAESWIQQGYLAIQDLDSLVTPYMVGVFRLPSGQLGLWKEQRRINEENLRHDRAVHDEIAFQLDHQLLHFGIVPAARYLEASPLGKGVIIQYVPGFSADTGESEDFQAPGWTALHESRLMTEQGWKVGLLTYLLNSADQNTYRHILVMLDGRLVMTDNSAFDLDLDLLTRINLGDNTPAAADTPWHFGRIRLEGRTERQAHASTTVYAAREKNMPSSLQQHLSRVYTQRESHASFVENLAGRMFPQLQSNTDESHVRTSQTLVKQMRCLFFEKIHLVLDNGGYLPEHDETIEAAKSCVQAYPL